MLRWAILLVLVIAATTAQHTSNVKRAADFNAIYEMSLRGARAKNADGMAACFESISSLKSNPRALMVGLTRCVCDNGAELQLDSSRMGGFNQSCQRPSTMPVFSPTDTSFNLPYYCRTDGANEKWPLCALFV